MDAMVVEFLKDKIEAVEKQLSSQIASLDEKVEQLLEFKWKTETKHTIYICIVSAIISGLFQIGLIFLQRS